jgi:WD40 repeat protein
MRVSLILIITICFVFRSVQAQSAYENSCANFTNHEVSSSINVIAMNPTVNQLAIGGDNGIEIYAMPEFETLLKLETPDEEDATLINIQALAWSPNGDYIAVAKADDIYIWEVSSQHIQTIWEAPPDNSELMATEFPNESTGPLAKVYSLAWSPDGNYLAAIGTAPLRVLAVADNEVIFEGLELFEGDIQGTTAPNLVAWSPDGNYLTMIFENEVHVWDTQDWELVNTLTAEPQTTRFEGISWSLGGILTAFYPLISWNNMTAWQSIGFDSEFFRGVSVAKWSSNQSNWLALGQWTPAGEAEIAIVDIESERTILMRAIPHDQPIFDILWFSDGERIMSIDFSYTIAIWDIVNECLIAVIEPVQEE